MLISDLRIIGNKLLCFRKQLGMTQAQIAEVANISDRTYADIERGTVNMRLETLLQICEALHITPDDLLTQEPPHTVQLRQDINERLACCTDNQKMTALRLIEVYLDSLQ